MPVCWLPPHSAVAVGVAVVVGVAVAGQGEWAVGIDGTGLERAWWRGEGQRRSLPALSVCLAGRRCRRPVYQRRRQHRNVFGVLGPLTNGRVRWAATVARQMAQRRSLHVVVACWADCGHVARSLQVQRACNAVRSGERLPSACAGLGCRGGGVGRRVAVAPAQARRRRWEESSADTLRAWRWRCESSRDASDAATARETTHGGSCAGAAQ